MCPIKDPESVFQTNAIWPVFRYDQQNSGNSQRVGTYQGDTPWHFQTGKGIFSTPIIDAEGTVYFGSADHVYYALNPDGSLKWQFKTGEIIDSAGVLPALTQDDPAPRVLFPSGDGYLYMLNTHTGDLLWKFDARVAPRSSYNDWWEANVTIGPDGTFYAGNTNFNYYAIHPDGSLKWTYETGSNCWSNAAFGADGRIFWGSCDTKVRGVDPDGSEAWAHRTLGFISASAVVGSDGTVYIGSFDSNLYAFDPDTGKVKWKYKTSDHIYASAALGKDATGKTTTIFVGSTDGRMYALNPNGTLRWQFDAGAPIRSSPVIGAAPDGASEGIVYFGCGSSEVYALNAADGSRRWSYDTTPDGAEHSDRNDLNGSPALGANGLYIGGEHGQLWYLPYDYPIHHPEDPRGSTQSSADLPDNFLGVKFITPGGNLSSEAVPEVPAAVILTLKLISRVDGQTRDVRFYNLPVLRPADAVQITSEPPFPFDWEQSADGHYLHIFPQGFLEPGQEYTLTVSAKIYQGGIHLGNLSVGGRKVGQFTDTFKFNVRETGSAFPLVLQKDKTTAFEFTRLAVPIPTMLPSLNQIGFDYMDWIIGLVSKTTPDSLGRGKVVLWAVGGKWNEDGELVVDPDSDFTLPFSGDYQKDAFIVSNSRFTMEVTGIPIPFNLFQLRGQFAPDLRILPGATAYADTKVLSIPTFGPLLVVAGLANNIWQRLMAMVTYVTRPYKGTANLKPAGITVKSHEVVLPAYGRNGQVTVQIEHSPGVSFYKSAHRLGILLLDEQTLQTVPLDYHNLLHQRADADGNLISVSLVIPSGTDLPLTLEAIVIADVFPLYEFRLW